MTALIDPLAEREVAERVLSQYELEPCSVDFLQHSGAITYRVCDIHGAKYLLRIYAPISEYMANNWVHVDQIRSEMMWLSYLHEEGSVSVQAPLMTKKGDWITILDEEPERQVACALLRWIDGECNHAEILSGTLVEQCGLLLAQLHNLWSTWSPPAGFVRPRYDTDYLEHAFEEAAKHVDRDVILSSDFLLFEKSTETIYSLMKSLGESAFNWGLIHGDFSQINIVRHNDTLSPIDFAECGFGHYMQDVGHCLLRLGPEKQNFLKAYKSIRCLPDNAQFLADAFCLASIVHWLAFTASLPDRYEKVARLVKDPTMNFCRSFLAGKSFLFPDGL